MHSLLTEPQKAQTVILAVSPDPVARVRLMVPKVTAATRRPFALELLSDGDHAVTDRYGLRNPEAVARGWYVPHPTTYVIDRQGIVRWKKTDRDYRSRASNAEILAALRKLK